MHKAAYLVFGRYFYTQDHINTTYTIMNPTKIRLLYFLLLTSILFSGCDFSSFSDPIILTDVEDEFFLDLWEEITPQGRSFQFRIATIENQECSNAAILYDIIQEGSNIDISLQEITTPQDCIPATTPAVENIDLGSLPNQYFALKIDLRKAVVNRAHFTISSDAYEIDMQSEHGIKPIHTQLLRIPQEMNWGYISYPTTLSAVANECIAALEEVSASYLPPNGYYGYFTVANNNMAIHDQPENQPLKTIIFDLEDESQQNKIKNNLQALRKQGKIEPHGKIWKMSNSIN